MISKYSTNQIIQHVERLSGNEKLRCFHILKDLNYQNITLSKTSKAILEKNNLFTGYRSSSVGVANFPVVNRLGQNHIRQFSFKDELSNKSFPVINLENEKIRLVLKIFYDQLNLNLKINGKQDHTVLNSGLNIILTTSPFDIVKDSFSTFVDFNETSVSGDSFGFALVVAMYSFYSSLPIDKNFIFSGAFQSNNDSKAVGDLITKYEVCKQEYDEDFTFFIPDKSFLTDNEKIFFEDKTNLEFITNFNDLIVKVFRLNDEKYFSFNGDFLRKINSFIKGIDKGNKLLSIDLGYKTIEKSFNLILYNFVIKNPSSYDIFFPSKYPLNNCETFLDPPILLVLNGTLPIILSLNISEKLRPADIYLAPRYGKDTLDCIVSLNCKRKDELNGGVIKLPESDFNE